MFLTLATDANDTSSTWEKENPVVCTVFLDERNKFRQIIILSIYPSPNFMSFWNLFNELSVEVNTPFFFSSCFFIIALMFFVI